MEEGVEERNLVTFESSGTFFELLNQCLGLVVPARLVAEAGIQPVPATARIRAEDGLAGVRKEAEKLLKQMREILDPYSEQSQTYLLDPYLERMIASVSKALRVCVRDVHAALLSAEPPDPESIVALDSLGRIIYLYSRIRGYKTINHFFPHEVEDLHPLVDVLEATVIPTETDASAAAQHKAPLTVRIAWEARYTLLLWLSLVCMIPFNLRQFDRPGQSTTVDRITGLARVFIGVTGVEREASVVLVGRLYQRPETQDALQSFLLWSSTSLGPDGDASIYLRTGILFSLCELLKVLDPQRVAKLMPLFHAVLAAVEGSKVFHSAEDSGNAQIGKAHTKLIGRLALKQLPPRPRRRKRIRALGAADAPAPGIDPFELDQDEADIPEEVEGYLGELLDGLSHESSQVRSSAAKGVARISERLPDSFVVQVLDSILALFSDNSLCLPDGSIDMNAASEASWQGACLALAEMARRDLLSSIQTSAGEDAITWIQRALMFDVRRGGRGVGTAVRDAACYVFWAMARAHDLRSIGPHVEGPEGIAATLVCAACCDREVSIRRAASAAFQEAAGRLGILPHGLEIIRIADFLAVGVRRYCFLNVLPSVAQYEPYQVALLRHLQSTALAHWDASMRELAAQALALVVRISPSTLLVEALKEASRETRDPLLQHGRLLALASLAPIAREMLPSSQRTCFVHCALRYQARLTPTSSGRQMSEAVCRLLAQSMDDAVYRELWDQAEPGHAILADVTAVLKEALVRPEAGLQWVAVDALRELTAAAASTSGAIIGAAQTLFDEVVLRWVDMEPAEQEGWGKALGALMFLGQARADGDLDRPEWKVAQFLLDVLTPSSSYYSQVVEARRDASASVVQVLMTNRSLEQVSLPVTEGSRLHGHISVPDTLLGRIIDTLIQGTADYSVDRRGDVGSWVRSASMTALGRLYQSLSADGLALERAPVVEGALLKEMGERNDGVRGNGARALVHVVRAVQVHESHDATPLSHLVEEIKAARLEMCEPGWLFPRMVPLLSNVSLGPSVLEGLLVSVGQAKDSYNNDAVTSINTWIDADDGPSESKKHTILKLLQGIAQASLSKNKIMVPVLRLVMSLLRMSNNQPSDETVDLLQKFGQTALRALTKVRNVVRLDASRDVCIALLGVSKPAYQQVLVKHTAWFLSHPDESLRASTSESLALALDDLLDSRVLQLQDTNDTEAMEQAREECEDILLSTPWASLPSAKAAAAKIERLLRTMLLPPM